MMEFVHIAVAVLSLLSLGHSAPVTSCENLIQPREIYGSQLLGKWILVGDSSSIPGSRGLHFIRHHLDTELGETSTNSGLFDEDDGSMGSGKPVAEELERYLSCHFTGGVELLHGFPHIKKLSIKVNTALPASAACERLFSHAGLLFTAQRSQLHSKNLESQLLLKLKHHFTD